MSIHKQHLEIILCIITLNKFGWEEKVNDSQNWFINETLIGAVSLTDPVTGGWIIIRVIWAQLKTPVFRGAERRFLQVLNRSSEISFKWQ